MTGKSANFVQDVPDFMRDFIKLLEPISSQRVRDDPRAGTGACDFAGLSRKAY